MIETAINLDDPRICFSRREVMFWTAKTAAGCDRFWRVEAGAVRMPLCAFIIANGMCPKGRTVEPR